MPCIRFVTTSEVRGIDIHNGYNYSLFTRDKQVKIRVAGNCIVPTKEARNANTPSPLFTFLQNREGSYGRSAPFLGEDRAILPVGGTYRVASGVNSHQALKSRM